MTISILTPNPMRTLATPLTTTARRTVDLDVIERELQLLWKEAGDAHTAVRACTLNVVIVSVQAGGEDPLHALADAVVERHPSRIILIQAAPSGPDGPPEAGISARCAMAHPGVPQVCCELISIAMGGRWTAAIAPTVASLLVSDVPAVVCWSTSPLHLGGDAQALGMLADKEIINSSVDPSPARLLDEWSRHAHRSGVAASLSDCAWARTGPWQALLAQRFQQADHQRHLSFLDSLKIEFSSSVSPYHSGFPEAVYLVSWLASRLRWSVMSALEHKRDGSYAGAFSAPGGTVIVRLTPVVTRSGQQGAIESIALTSSEGLSVVIRTSTSCLRVTETSQAVDDAVSDQTRMSDSDALVRELDHLGPDANYQAALGVAARFLAELIL